MADDYFRWGTARYTIEIVGADKLYSGTRREPRLSIKRPGMDSQIYTANELKELLKDQRVTLSGTDSTNIRRAVQIMTGEVLENDRRLTQHSRPRSAHLPYTRTRRPTGP